MRSTPVALLGALLLAAAVPFSSVQAQTFRSAETEQPVLNGFGQTVAVQGRTLFIGEPLNAYRPGVIHQYNEGADGTWMVGAELMASDGDTGDRFGASLAAVEGRLLIGATARNESRGGAYVFEQNGESWQETAQLIPTDAAADDRVGATVALSGDVALVGTTRQAERAGAVYVFRYDGTTWQQEAKLTTPDTTASVAFGAALAVDGNWALVGAPFQGEGKVYAFQYDGTTWQPAGTLEAANLTAGDRFGTAIAMADGEALVGLPRASSGIGAVTRFAYDGEAWNEIGRLLPFDGSTQHAFGSAIAMAGGDVLVGAPGGFRSRIPGFVYRFVPDGEGNWSAADKLMTDGAERGTRYGSSLAGNADVVVAGLAGADYGAGTAVIFVRDGGDWREAQAPVFSTFEALSAVQGELVRCEEGDASGFDCGDMDLISFLPIRDIGGERGVRLNDIWGWTDPETGTEYALVGRMDGTSFVDVSNPYQPVFVGDLPKTEGSPGSAWRDIKVYQDHAYVVSDNAGEHGMQVFDLTRLRDVTVAEMPVTFEPETTYDRVNSVHNIVINEETGFAYAVGSGGGGETCGGGLHMIDIREPKNPTFAGCFADATTGRASTGYTHDAQCVTYDGPDAEHQGREICFSSNETALSVADVTDKANPVALSTAAYPNVSYTHQGWLTEDHQFLYVNDELDELGGNVTNTRTLIWDVTDLDDPQLVREFLHETTASDHNLYIRGNFMYQSNYAAGLRVFDITDRANPVPVGHFDTAPAGSNGPGFSGTWSNYPYFQSGIVVVSSIGEGLFIVKKKDVDI
ncbi:MAG: choice-of-anchor B family protein [Bacteroidota bacterium]